MFVLAAAVSLTACGGGNGSGAREPAQAQPANRCDPTLDRALRRWADAGFSGSIAISAGGRRGLPT